MPLGQGTYDDLCTYVREKSRGQGVLVAVIGGDKGSGFSVQITNPLLLFRLAKILHETADEIEKSLRKGDA
jgi:hypothetical protein